MGLALLVVIWLITFASTYFFVAKTWWLPTGAAAAVGFIDGQFALTFILMGIVFVAAQLKPGIFLLEISGKTIFASGGVHAWHGSVKLEIIWTVLTTILPDGKPRLGEPAIRSGRAGRGESGSDWDAVCVVLPLSRAGWKIRRDPIGCRKCSGA